MGKTGNETRPVIAVTAGDPAGVGPEICLSVLRDPAVREMCCPVVFGDAGIFRRVAAALGKPEPVAVMPLQEWKRRGTVNGAPTLVDCALVEADEIQPGRVQAACGNGRYVSLRDENRAERRAMGREDWQTFAIIADDLSGAAEVAGVACRFGLSAEVLTQAGACPQSAVTVFDTDSRSLSALEAARRVEQACHTLRSNRHVLYKKVDSILRGPVFAEISALLASTGMRRALLVPANPALGRVVRDGLYWIDGLPIDQTDFRNDPDNPVRSSRLADMLHCPDPDWLSIAHPGAGLPHAGVCIGEASLESHLDGWAAALDAQTLAVGAAAFLAAILKSRGHRVVGASYVRPEKVLLVSGSAYSASRERLEGLRRSGVPGFPMPERLYRDGEESQIGPWAQQVAEALRSGSLATVCIDRPADRPSEAARLSAHLAKLIQAVLLKCRVDQLCVEGGATASAIIRSAGWTRLNVQGEVAPGVVQIQPGDGPLLVLKPGSYPWPEILF